MYKKEEECEEEFISVRDEENLPARLYILDLEKERHIKATLHTTM